MSVIVVDHGLRAASQAESYGVVAAAEHLGLTAERLVWTGPKPATGIQEAARDARYALFAAWAARCPGTAAIATAHHKDDQAEGLLQRLARSSGVDGLAGMRPVTSLGGLTVLRPLLDASKSALATVLSDRGVDSVDDPSNRDTTFERARLRRHMTELSAIGLTADALAGAASRLARASDALEQATDVAMADMLRRQRWLPYGAVTWSPRSDVPDEIALRLLRRLLEVCGGHHDDAPFRDLAALERLWDRLRSGACNGATLGQCQFSRIDGELVCHREANRRPLAPAWIGRETAVLWDNRFTIWPAAAVAARDCSSNEHGGRRILAYRDTPKSALEPDSRSQIDQVPQQLRAALPVLQTSPDSYVFPTFCTATPGRAAAAHVAVFRLGRLLRQANV